VSRYSPVSAGWTQPTVALQESSAENQAGMELVGAILSPSYTCALPTRFNASCRELSRTREASQHLHGPARVSGLFAALQLVLTGKRTVQLMYLKGQLTSGCNADAARLL